MDIRCIIVFKNNDMILHARRKYRKTIRVGWVLRVWKLEIINNRYLWVSDLDFSFAKFILNYDKRRLIAIKYAKKHNLPILYRQAPTGLSTAFSPIKFSPSDLIKMRTVHGR